MNGAFAYKQVGEYDKAIEMYELFINDYGNEKTLAKLEKGDPKTKPPEPKKYEERVKYLKQAYDALSERTCSSSTTARRPRPTTRSARSTASRRRTGARPRATRWSSTRTWATAKDDRRASAALAS